MFRQILRFCTGSNTILPGCRLVGSSSSLVALREGQYSSFDSHQEQYQVFNEHSPVWSCNEWDPLEEVIVGRPDNAVVPHPRPEVKACLDPTKWPFFEQHGGKYWADVVPEHWKKLVAEVDNFVKVLEAEGVKVVRPDVFDHQKEFKTPFFGAQGFYSAMPRDILLVVADEIIEATMTWRQRFFEFYSYRSLVKDYWSRGAKWTAAPKPACNERLIDESYDTDDVKKRSDRQMRGEFVTSESEPTFDAADFMRAGTDIFAQRSQVTNQAGIEWVRRHLAPKGIRVHEIRFRDPRPMHIDSTFLLVKPGIALCNPVRPLIEHAHEKFTRAGWKLVEVPYPTMKKEHPLWLSSEWLAMNCLSLSTEQIFVEKNEEGYQKMFEKIGMKPIPVSIQHMNSIGGGFHCWTCDVRRRGKLECYF